jgi:hypothetical protein
VSNDQSPPARKVIPYKKGGQRKSPFADMAFQFSGTALDVAIQQREDVAEDAPSESSESPAPELPQQASTGDSSAPEALPSQEVRDTSRESEPPQPRAAEVEVTPAPPPTASPRPPQRRSTARDERHVTDRKSGQAAIEISDAQLQTFLSRWKPFLTETQLGICTHIYRNSVSVGRESCFTSTAKLMAAVSKTERQVKTVINQLIDWGFLVKGETVINAPREDRGTYYRLNIDKA